MSKPLILQMDLWEASEFHKRLKETHRLSKNAVHLASRAYAEAMNASCQAYATLAHFEGYLLELEEAHGLEGCTEYVTIEKDNDDGEAA